MKSTKITLASGFPALYRLVFSRFRPEIIGTIVLFRSKEAGVIVYSPTGDTDLRHQVGVNGTDWQAHCGDKSVWERYEGQVILENKI